MMVAVGVDRWNATQIVTQLTSESIRVEPMGQGYASLSSPTKATETAILKAGLRVGDNKCLQWQISNCTTKSDPAGNIKLVKPDSHAPGRIDAAVALVMAMGLSIAEAVPDDDIDLMVI